MLAYVFSHSPEPGADRGAYESLLRRFHAALAASPPRGFVRSGTFRHEEGYSDWYLLDGFAALETLNEAAVSGRRAEPHDAVAAMSGSGSGKLMTLSSGSPALRDRYEVRFSKPRGVSYADLDTLLRPWTGQSGVSLWKRAMVLGPAPEFSLLCQAAVELPFETSPRLISLELI